MAVQERVAHDPMAKMLAATRFAAYKHRDQRRKDPSATPYINHPITVAHILYFEGGIEDTDVLVAAVLHDTVEDTETTPEEIERLFGTRVRELVGEVTDDTSLPQKVRKQAQVDKAPKISRDAKQIKLADKISNLRDIHRDPPKNWSATRQQDYFRWAARVVEGLRGVNSDLERAFDEISGQFFSSQEG